MKPSNVFSWEILLVEDNSADVFLTQEALKESNISHNLQLAGDGVAALEYLQQEGDNAGAVRPDIILLDLDMPRMGGHKLLARIKADEVLKNIPVIVLSSSAAADDIFRAYALNANCYTDVIKGIQEIWLKPLGLPLGSSGNPY
jgi:CheY-like chemotaxis protein